MEAKQTSLIDLLERVPQDARLVVEHDQFSSSSHPVGRLCHEAAAALRAALSQPVQEQAEPEQEPAGWFEGPFWTFRANQLYKISWPASTVAWRIPLYTAPPVRHPLAQLKGGGNLPPPLQGSTVAETATTQQPVEQTPSSEYRRGYWDGFAIGKREGRIEAEDALRADAERLAWLDKFALSVDMVADPDNLVQVWHSTTRPPYSTTGSTLREAIDAAREAK